jgi:hypothetical protein
LEILAGGRYWRLQGNSVSNLRRDLGINGDSMVSVSVTAVIRSHAQILENMAAKLEELARRTQDMGEAKKLRQLSNTYRLLGLQHQDWFTRDDDRPKGKSEKQSA